MSVLTISRETGSGGRYIAENVAEVLGYQLVDKNLIGRVYSKYARDEFGTDVGYVPDLWSGFESPPDERRELMVHLLNQVILALAHRDRMVIVGRSGFAVLAEFADVFHVRIQAPLPLRIQRVMERRKIAEPAQAEALVRESDRVRAAFIEGYYGKRWDKSKAFDLVIDTGKIPEALAINWLIQAVERLQKQIPPYERCLESILVQPILENIVSQEFERIRVRKHRLPHPNQAS